MFPYARVLLSSSQALLYRDLSALFIPNKFIWMTAVQEIGRIPHWDPMRFAGFPNFVDPGCGPLYPLNWLLFLFGPPSEIVRSLTYWIVLHHILIYCGFYFLFRDMRVRPWLSLSGALTLAWAGPAVSSDNLLHQICSQAAVGFFFLFWRRTLRKPRIGFDLFASSLALGWPIYGGDPQYSYVLGVLGGLYALVFYAPLQRKFRKLILLVVLAGMVSAPQLLPTLHQLATVGRTLDTMQDDNRLAWSLAPLRLFEFSFPLPFGSAQSSKGISLDGIALDAPPVPFIFSMYIGVLATAFAIFHLGLILPRLRRRSRNNLKDALALSFFLFVVLACMGRYAPIPVYGMLVKVAPFWHVFRYPERLGYWVCFLLVAFAFRGAEKFVRLQERKCSISVWPAGLVMVLISLGFGALLFLHHSSLVSAAHTLLLGLTWAMAMSWRRFQRFRGIVLVLFLLADMVPMARLLVRDAPKSQSEPNGYPWAMKILDDQNQRRASLEAGAPHRFFSFVVPSQLGAGTSFPVGVESLSNLIWTGMLFDAPTVWRIPLVSGYAALDPNRPILSLAGNSGEFVRRALNLTSTRYFLTVEKGVPKASVNLEALPQVTFPETGQLISDSAALVAKLKDPSWDYRHAVLVESTVKIPPARGAISLVGLHRAWDEIILRVRAEEASPVRWLLLNEAFDSQWTVRGERGQLPLVRANGWAMAALLPKMRAGTEVKFYFSYRDAWYEAGRVILLIWILLALLSSLPSRRWPYWPADS